MKMKNISKKIISLTLSTAMLASNVMVTCAHKGGIDYGKANEKSMLLFRIFQSQNNDTALVPVGPSDNNTALVPTGSGNNQGGILRYLFVRGASIMSVATSLSIILANYDNVMCTINRITLRPVMFCRKMFFEKFGGFKNPKEISKNLNKSFKKIKGQKNAKKQIKDFISAMLENFDPNSNSAVKGNVLYLSGPSGVGKSYIVQLISESILKRPKDDLFRVDPARMSGGSRGGHVDDVLNNTYESNEGMRAYSLANVETSTLPVFLASHPQGIVWLDEYDKYSQPTNFDEQLRSILDCGLFVFNGNTMDCSKILFIITSNEVREALDNRYDAIKQDKSQTDNEQIDNNSDGSTYVNHRRCLLNRFKPVMFEKLKDENLNEIATSFLKEKLAYFKEKYGFNIEINENVVTNMVSYAKYSNKQARGITFDLDTLLTSEVTRHAYDDDLSTTTFELSYNFDESAGKDDDNYSGEFKLKEKTSDKVTQAISTIDYKESFTASLSAVKETLKEIFNMEITLEDDFQSNLDYYLEKNSNKESELFEKLKDYLSKHLDNEEKFSGKDFVLSYEFDDTDEDENLDYYGSFCLSKMVKKRHSDTCPCSIM